MEIRNTNFKGDVERLARAIDGLIHEGKGKAFTEEGQLAKTTKKHKYLTKIFFLWIGALGAYCGFGCFIELHV